MNFLAFSFHDPLWIILTTLHVSISQVSQAHFTFYPGAILKPCSNALPQDSVFITHDDTIGACFPKAGRVHIAHYWRSISSQEIKLDCDYTFILPLLMLVIFFLESLKMNLWTQVPTVRQLQISCNYNYPAVISDPTLLIRRLKSKCWVHGIPLSIHIERLCVTLWIFKNWNVSLKGK